MTTHALKRSVALLLAIACTPAFKAGAAEDIEYVAEHLAEVPMDNRIATLPVWGPTGEGARAWSFAGQAAYSDTTTGNLKAAGPLFSVAADRFLDRRWSFGVFAFFDSLDLTGNHDERPLQTKFSPHTPLDLPVMARFDNLNGSMRHYGGGVRFTLAPEQGKLGMFHWVGGLLWQRVELRDYRLDYLVLEGDDAGTTGTIDFDADYDHITPFVGFEVPRMGTTWAMTPHVLAAWPNPRYGVVGHITGPGFDLRGDTEEAGEGKHFGDPWISLGLDVTYLPAHFTVDVGTLLTQRLIEPVVHKGIDADWVISFQWRF
jgi:hypothetical protein